MHRRINITLPEETIRLLDRMAEKGNRSHLIDEAIRRFVRKGRRVALRNQLKEGAIKRAERDLLMAEDWFTLEEEVWQRDRK